MHNYWLGSWSLCSKIPQWIVHANPIRTQAIFLFFQFHAGPFEPLTSDWVSLRLSHISQKDYELYASPPDISQRSRTFLEGYVTPRSCEIQKRDSIHVVIDEGQWNSEIGKNRSDRAFMTACRRIARRIRSRYEISLLTVTLDIYRPAGLDSGTVDGLYRNEISKLTSPLK